jgi:hypothetical protein
VLCIYPGRKAGIPARVNLKFIIATIEIFDRQQRLLIAIIAVEMLLSW